MDRKVSDILNKVIEGTPPSKEDCIYLLGFHESTPEATFTRGAANDIARRKTGNTGLLFGQIGLELYPCEADCKFCSFGKSHTGFQGKITLNDETIRQKVWDFTKDGDLYCLWLMTMDTFDLDYYINALKIARETAPPQTLLYTNVGDVDYGTFVKLKAAGADGAYHVVRLAQIAAVNALAMTAVDPFPWIPVHEADYISFTSGANSICAETGVNPRDTHADTSRGRGLDVTACRKMLWQAGFKYAARGGWLPHRNNAGIYFKM